MKAWIYNGTMGKGFQANISSIEDGMKKSSKKMFSVEAPWYENDSDCYIFFIAFNGNTCCYRSKNNSLSGDAIEEQEALEKFREIRYNIPICYP